MAVREGDVKILKRLVLNEESSKSPKLMDCRSKNGRTPMHTACLHGRREAVNFLLDEADDKMAVLNAKDSCGSTPIMEAVRGGHRDLVDTLANLGENLLYDMDVLNRNCLHTAAHCGHPDIIEYLVVNRKMNVNGSIESPSTPLHWAAKEGQVEAVEKLVTLQANTQRMDDHQRIPLALAIGGQHVQTASVLLEADFDIPFDVKLANLARTQPMKNLLVSFFKRHGVVLFLPGTN